MHGDGIGAEGVCEDDLAAGFNVSASYSFNLIGVGKVPGVGRGAGGEAAQLQLRSPRAIGDHEAVSQPFVEAAHCWPPTRDVSFARELNALTDLSL